MKRVKNAVARWDTDSNPYNPGWVVDVEFEDGSRNTFPPAPKVYQLAEKDENKSEVVAQTLIWESLVMGPYAG